MSLSDTAIKAAKAAPGKTCKLSDSLGLYLLIHSNGGKYWRFDYRFDGKRKTLSLGTYPETKLKQARSKRDIAREQIANGIEPGEHKKAVKQSRIEAAANSFEVIGLEWIEKKIAPLSASHKKRVLGVFNRDLVPYE